MGSNRWLKEWPLCLGSSSRFSYERIRVTQGFLYISPRVALNTTPSTSKKKFCIGSHLKHPQSSEFDANRAAEKPDLNQFFQKSDDKEGWQGKMARKDDKEGWWLLSLHTCLPTHLSHRYICVPTGRSFRLGIYLRLSTFRDMQFVILDCRSTRRGSWAVGWTQSTLLPYVIVSLTISWPE